MKKPAATLITAVPLAAALAAQAMAQQVPSVPPVARKVPHTTSIHGYTLSDDYFWLREKANPEVTAYLEAENAYTEAVMRPTKALQETLYKEMLGRIKQTDLSVPSRIGEYFYYSRTEEGKQYPFMCRRQGSMTGAEEVAARPQSARRGPQVPRPRGLRRQRRRQLAGVLARHDRLPAVRPARAGPAHGARLGRTDRAGRLGRLGDRQQDALLHDRGRGIQAVRQGVPPRRRRGRAS